jgi:hypothetical protein
MFVTGEKMKRENFVNGESPKGREKKRFTLCFPSKNGYFFEALLFLFF